MCDHLYPLEIYLKEKGIAETFRGQPWTDNCKEWVYFDCMLATEALKAKFHLPFFIVTHENTDLKSGVELGLFCMECNDAIIGLHPDYPATTKKLMVD